MKIKTEILTLLFLSSLVLWFFGCASISKQDKQMESPTVLEPQATLKFSDVPVPVGFKFLPQDSYSFESAGLRVGLLKYQGKTSADEAVNFYKEQMPMYNWNLLNIVEYGQHLLNFEREQESCIISLLPKGSSTILTISIGPKSQLPKKEDKPVK